MAPPISSGGLLDSDGQAPESHELPVWRTPSTFENTSANAAPRRRRWLGCIPVPGTIDNGGPKQLRPTAYLDGLRGFAAFLVYIHHHELWAHLATPDGNEMLENGFGYKGRHAFATFPIVRNFFSGGHIAVAIFYVISGYVLSAKGLSLIHAGEHMRLLDSLSSSVFRRWFRLYIPIIVTNVFYITLWHCFGGIWVANADPKGSLIDEWWEWYLEFKNYSFLFKENIMWVSCNKHLWSIPLEMRGSIIVFCALLSLSRATNRARLLCTAGLVYYFMYIVDGYYGSMFLMGMLLCDLDMMARRNDPDFPAFLRYFEPYKKTFCYGAFVLSMLLAGVPSEQNSVEILAANPGWYYLSKLKPQAVFDAKWFFLFWSATLMVFCVPRIPLLRRFFESGFCQYFGRHSYALYLVHGPILATLGDRVYTMVGWIRDSEAQRKMLAPYVNVLPLPRVGPLGLEISFLLPHLLLMPFTFWISEMVTVYIDDKAVSAAAWLFKKTLGGGGASAAVPKPEDTARLA